VLRRKARSARDCGTSDRLMFVWFYRLYPSLLDAIIIVRPETVNMARLANLPNR